MHNSTLDSFEAWWEDTVMAFALENGLPIHYVEEEFIIDGELVPVKQGRKYKKNLGRDSSI